MPSSFDSFPPPSSHPFNDATQADTPAEDIRRAVADSTAASCATLDISLERINSSPAGTCRQKLNEDVLENLTEALRADPHSVPPVSVYRDGDTYWLADGAHRVTAARRLGHATITALVRSGDRFKAIEEAACSNRQHGAPRTRADKRRAVAAALCLPGWSNRSNRLIADHVGVDAKLVDAVRKQLEAAGTIASTEQRVSADGRVRPARGKRHTTTPAGGDTTQGPDPVAAPTPSEPLATSLEDQRSAPAQTKIAAEQFPTTIAAAAATTATDPHVLTSGVNNTSPAEPSPAESRQIFLESLAWVVDQAPQWLSGYDTRQRQQLRDALRQMLAALDAIDHPQQERSRAA